MRSRIFFGRFGPGILSVMYAIVATSRRLEWRRVPDASAGCGEVLIRVHAAGTNRADLLQAAGKYPPPPGASEILGLEVSGVIVEVGDDVVNLSPGQPVCALLAGGGYAELVAVPARQVLPIPDGIATADAAGLPEVACTVWSNLVMAGRLSPGEFVLVHGGAGGIGTHAIQVAKAMGAVVAATAGSAAKLELCAALGADIVISHRDEDFAERVCDATSGGGADLILDVMGAAYLQRNLSALGRDGRLVIIGMQGGVKAELDIGTLIGKRLTVIGTALRNRPVDGPHGKGAIIDAVARAVWPMISRGQVRPVIGARFPIERASDAIDALASGQTFGKILLNVAG